MALQLISPPKKPTPQAPPEVWQGPATPPVDGLEPIFGRLPKGVSQQWLLDMAWDWRNSCAIPEVQIPVRVPSESHLLEMEKVAPQVAATYRQQIAETIAGNKRIKLTRTIARVQQLIVNQYGWPKQA